MTLIFLLLILKNQFLTSSAKKGTSFTTKTLFRNRINNEKVHHVLEFDQSKWLKPYVEFNTEKRIEAQKNCDKDGKAFYKLMSNSDFGKIEKNLRMVNNKNFLKRTSKPSYAAQAQLFRHLTNHYLLECVYQN